jgi:hypothetical protein
MVFFLHEEEGSEGRPCSEKPCFVHSLTLRERQKKRGREKEGRE